MLKCVFSEILILFKIRVTTEIKLIKCYAPGGKSTECSFHISSIAMGLDNPPHASAMALDH
jgi:hypothetical protein